MHFWDLKEGARQVSSISDRNCAITLLNSSNAEITPPLCQKLVSFTISVKCVQQFNSSESRYIRPTHSYILAKFQKNGILYFTQDLSLLNIYNMFPQFLAANDSMGCEHILQFNLRFYSDQISYFITRN